MLSITICIMTAHKNEVIEQTGIGNDEFLTFK